MSDDENVGDGIFVCVVIDMMWCYEFCVCDSVLTKYGVVNRVISLLLCV